MDEDLKLYIPLGVKPEAELFTGFGRKQLFQSLIGSLPGTVRRRSGNGGGIP